MLNIEFSAHEDYLSLKEDLPKPVKTNIPEWYKHLSHGERDKEKIYTRTIKGCMPFLETLTTGYLLKIPVDYKLEHGVHKDENGKPITKLYTSIEAADLGTIINVKGHNLNPNTSNHPIEQLEGSPFIKKNGNLPFVKIINPWTIKTPKGYSCLFLNPLNNSQQDFFTIIPGIVHTDSFEQEVNFPIVVNHEKYGNLDLVIEKGTPYVQVIPFKRDDWKMSIKAQTPREQHKRFLWGIQFIKRYRNKIFNKNKTQWI